VVTRACGDAVVRRTRARIRCPAGSPEGEFRGDLLRQARLPGPGAATHRRVRTAVVHYEHPGHARTAASELQFTHELTSEREPRQLFSHYAHIRLAAARPSDPRVNFLFRWRVFPVGRKSCDPIEPRTRRRFAPGTKVTKKNFR